MQAHAGAAMADGIEQFDPAAVIFEDLGDDRETETGAFAPCRHIGLEQPLAVLDRESLAVVDDVDHDLLIDDLERDAIRPGSPPPAAGPRGLPSRS